MLNTKIWIFLFQRQKYFFSNSLDSVLSSASRDVFTGSSAQSIQELWPIIALPATVVTGAALKVRKRRSFKFANV